MSSDMTSNRPYLLRALYEWIADNQMTPHILVEAGAAEMMPEADSDPESMAAVLERLLGSRDELMRMACAARSVSVPDSADRVAALCMESMAA